MRLVLHAYGNHECADCGRIIYSGDPHILDDDVRICWTCWRYS